MTDNQASKSRLRQTLRQWRRGVAETTARDAAEALARHFFAIEEARKARRIALYWPNDGEIDTSALRQACRRRAIGVYLPVIAQGALLFGEWPATDPRLTGNRYGIPEPADSPTVTAGELDIICLPLVGWDIFGGRLGMGGGFYDRTLAGATGTCRIGLAYEGQRVERIPLESWDQVLHYVVTEVTHRRTTPPPRRH